jgi:two-component system NtrC family sensor kinase
MKSGAWLTEQVMAFGKPCTDGRVLVVDDEPPVRAALRACLRDHQVTAVSSAVEALKLLRDGSRFDVILCDMMMPEMSGMDFCLCLAKEDPGAAERVLFLSGGGFNEKTEIFLAQSSRPWLLKPWNPAELRALVASMCAEPLAPRTPG